MLSALQTQLTNGPLADLNSGVVDGNGFVSEVQSLVANFDQNVDQQLLPHFTHIDNMLKLQGQQVVANLVSLNQQSTVNPQGTVVGLTSPGSLPTQAGAAINTLTSGPIHSLNTPVSAYRTATQSFETDLDTVTDTLSSTAPTPLTLPEVSTTIQAEAEAYRASMDAGLQVTHPNISSTVNAAVTTLEDTVITIANTNDPTAESDIKTASAAFDAAILDTTGLFGPNGPVNRVNSELGYVPHNLTAKPTATTIDNVSGTATGGTATLMATLLSATGTGLGGKVVSFTLDGGFAGTAITDSSGVATLTGVPTTDAGGTYTGVVVASFAGDSQNLLSQNSGNLSVAPAVTGLSPTSGPAAGGTSVTITGTGFTGATGVDFGTTAATDVTVANDTTITADSPAGTGVVDVTVTTPGGTSATSTADQFTYAPTVTGLSPTSGPVAGGTSVTITGTGFTGATGVDFGTVAATGVTVVNSTTTTADSPAGTGTGVVDVTVTTPAGTSATSTADQFTYT